MSRTRHTIRATLAALLLAAVAAAACTNENHPPRDAKEVTGIFQEVMTNSDFNECSRNGLPPDPVTFEFRFQKDVSPSQSLTVVITAPAPPGPNEAVAVNVEGIIHPIDIDECDTPIVGAIRYEHRADIDAPPNNNFGPLKFAPTIIHSLWLPAQTLASDPTEQLAGIDCKDPAVTELPESRLIDGRFSCEDETALAIEDTKDIR